MKALEAAEMLAADGINAEVINIHTIKPLDEELVVAIRTRMQAKWLPLKSTPSSVVSAVLYATHSVQTYPTQVLKIGVYDCFGESGPGAELIKKYELDSEGIYKKVKGFMA